MIQATKSINKENLDENDAIPQNNEEFHNYSKDAEQINGSWAMIGIVALFGAYFSTGQIIPGIY